MPVTADKPAPYTAASAVLEVIDRHRSKGMPQPVNADTLARSGISESLIPRTLQALQTLDLIDEGGNVTQVLEGLRLAPEGEYQKRLAEWLNAAYADVLQYIDPATATETEVRDAFRLYQPVGQQSRMVTLFIMLYAAAGIGSGKQKATKTGGAPTAVRIPGATIRRKSPAKTETKKHAAHEQPNTGLPPALDGLLKSLPQNGESWTKNERDKFYTTFGAVLDFCIPIGERKITATENLEEDTG
jgi:hypothetical protein